jgi:Secretion system C-terminal sorting domain
VKIKIFDLLGKEVAALVNQKQNTGTYSIEFEAGNNASGVYLYRLEVDGNVIDTKRMILLK